MTPQVLFYVQHLLGIGHLVRAARIATALRGAGFKVHVALGGPAIEAVDWSGTSLHALPAIRAGRGGYADLVDALGRPVGDDLRAARRTRLLELFEAAAPDILLLEAFPFGRRAMRFELLPLLEAAVARQPRPLVATSIRDILHENRKAHLNQETVDLVKRYFDLVLVHGDPELIRLEASFPLAGMISGKLRYTGLVCAEPAAPAGGPACDVVVSAGGGAVGEALLETAALARPLSRHADARWCLVTGPNLPEPAFRRLERAANSGISVERFVPDLPALLAGARVSVSQCGYNTAADVLRAGARAVFVPMAYQEETEQVRRARILKERGLAVVLEEPDLTPENLARSIDAAALLAAPDPRLLPDLDGARRTAALLSAALAAGSRHAARMA